MGFRVCSTATGHSTASFPVVWSVVPLSIPAVTLALSAASYDEIFSYIRSFHASSRMNLFSREVVERKNTFLG